MQKTLIILAHPNIDESIGNQIITEFVNKEENISVKHLDKLYPNFEIDIKAEQDALMGVDNIVFQYPLYWYSTPAILKEWIDQVFQYGFAFGQNSILNDKNIIASITVGSPEHLYPNEVLEKILFPIKGLTDYCKLNYKGEVFSFNINNYTSEAKETAIENAKVHAQKLIALINQ